MNRFLQWVEARLVEKSTWLGVISILTVLGYNKGAEAITENIELIISTLGSVLVLMHEKRNNNLPAIMACLCIASLAACSDDIIDRDSLLHAACVADAVGQPIAVMTLAVVAPEAAPVLALDSRMIHPTIQAFCADRLNSQP